MGYFPNKDSQLAQYSYRCKLVHFMKFCTHFQWRIKISLTLISIAIIINCCHVWCRYLKLISLMSGFVWKLYRWAAFIFDELGNCLFLKSFNIWWEPDEDCDLRICDTNLCPGLKTLWFSVLSKSQLLEGKAPEKVPAVAQCFLVIWEAELYIHVSFKWPRKKIERK